MKKNLNEEYLNHAKGIGNHLISVAQNTPYGLTWKTPIQGYDNTITWGNSESIFNGVSGIILFLIKLYNHTSIDAYLQASIEACKWLISYCEHNPSNNHAFYTGRMGVVFTLIQMFEITKDPIYLEKSLEIVNHSVDQFNQSEFTNNSLFDGRGGAILVLMHLHSTTKQEWLLDSIHEIANKMISQAKLGEIGIYWTNQRKDINALNSFGNGMAGIGFVFLELGNYLQNDAYLSIAERALAFVNSQWNHDLKNWPDYRKEITSKNDLDIHLYEYSQHNMNFFTQAADSVCWQNGTIGIGLSFLRAYQMSMAGKYRYKLLRSINRILDVSKINLKKEYCNKKFKLEQAFFFFHANKVLKQKKYELFVLHNLTDLIEKEEKVFPSYNYQTDLLSDYTLFGQKVGLSYLLLLYLENKTDPPSVLYPSLSNTTPVLPSLGQEILKDISITAELRKALVVKAFNRCLQILDILIPEKIYIYFKKPSQPAINEKKEFIQFVKREISFLDEKYQGIVKEIFKIEKAHALMEKKFHNLALLHIKEYNRLLLINTIFNLTETQLLQQHFLLSDEIKIIEIKWNWKNLFQDQDYSISKLDTVISQTDDLGILLKPISDGTIQEVYLDDLDLTILNYFKRCEKLNDVLNIFKEFFEVKTEEQMKDFNNVVVRRIRRYIKEGILVASDN